MHSVCLTPDTQHWLDFKCVTYGVLHMVCLEPLDTRWPLGMHSYTHEQYTVTLALPGVATTAHQACG